MGRSYSNNIAKNVTGLMSRAWPHKNLTRLFEAYAFLRKHDPKLRLVLSEADIGWLPWLLARVDQKTSSQLGPGATLTAWECPKADGSSPRTSARSSGAATSCGAPRWSGPR